MKRIVLFLFLVLHLFSVTADSDLVKNIKDAVYSIDLQKPISNSNINNLIKPHSVQKYMSDLAMGAPKIHPSKTPDKVLEKNNIKRYWYTYFAELMHQHILGLTSIKNVFMEQDTRFNLIAKLTDNLFAISTPNNLFIYDHNQTTLQNISDLQSQIYLTIPINKGLQFATCSHDSIVQIWDTLTGRCLAKFKPHNAFIEKIFDTGNDTIMSFCAAERSTREWSFCGKNLDNRLFESDDSFGLFASSVPDKIFSNKYCSMSASEESVMLYDAESQKVIAEILGNANSVMLLTNNLITSCTGQGIQLYDLTTFACMQSLNMLFCHETNALVQTQCGNILFVLGGQLYFWEIYHPCLQELSLSQGALIIQLLRHKNDDSIFLHPDWYTILQELPYKFKMIYLEEFMEKIEEIQHCEIKDTKLGKRDERPEDENLPEAKKFYTE